MHLQQHTFIDRGVTMPIMFEQLSLKGNLLLLAVPLRRGRPLRDLPIFLFQDNVVFLHTEKGVLFKRVLRSVATIDCLHVKNSICQIDSTIETPSTWSGIELEQITCGIPTMYFTAF